jgi:RNA polymerase sigma-70 factor (ECF subfamily)
MNAIEGAAINHALTTPGFMQAVNAREKAAVRTLYMEYAKALYSYAFRITQSRVEAEDIVADTFEKFFRHEGQFDNIAKLRNFLYATAHNRSLNYLRDESLHADKQQEIARLTTVEEADVLTRIVENELMATIYELIQQLPEKQRFIVKATILEGKTAAEIAAELHISIADVYTNKHRALLYLRAYAVAHKIRFAIPIWYFFSRYL